MLLEPGLEGVTRCLYRAVFTSSGWHYDQSLTITDAVFCLLPTEVAIYFEWVGTAKIDHFVIAALRITVALDLLVQSHIDHLQRLYSATVRHRCQMRASKGTQLWFQRGDLLSLHVFDAQLADIVLAACRFQDAVEVAQTDRTVIFVRGLIIIQKLLEGGDHGPDQNVRFEVRHTPYGGQRSSQMMNRCGLLRLRLLRLLGN